MKMEDVRMEDINGWIGKLMDEIQNKVTDFPEQNENYLFLNISDVLEEFFNYPDYRRYN